MLQVTNLSKVYGPRTLFENVSFSLIPGERLGLVGRNGCGKSTLFRMILEEETPDSGKILIPKGYRVGHLAQHLVFTENTIVEEVCLGLPEDERDQVYRGEIILNGLGFSDSDFAKPPSAFSGGFQIRLNLAKLLLSEPNLLLLDEPTNYLDILSMRWLTNFLACWRDEVIIISHDRTFMDDVTTHTMFIHRGTIRKIKGGTEKLYTQVALDEEIFEKTRLNEDKKRKELEAFINRFRALASKASLVQSKIKALERMGQKEELSQEANLDFKFCGAPHPGKVSLEVKEASFHYPDSNNLISKLSLTVGKQDRIGIIGKNGKGKSTFLKLLAGELAATGGSISLSPNAKIGYFGQTNISRLTPHLTIEEEVGSANPLLHRTRVRAICGTMMFTGDDALKKISVLSGGEKSRVLLGKLLAQPSNVLLLDEPTNHLDMESIEALVESLKNYEGAVIMVTHSELILRALVNRLVVFQGEAPKLFDHEYDYFLEKEGWEEEGGASPSQHQGSVSPEPIITKTAESAAQKELSKQMKSCEKQISSLEEDLKKTETLLAKSYENGKGEESTTLGKKLGELKSSIDRQFDALEKLEAKYKES
jgi:ATP-binding cassette, subfamily F, member 3